MTDQEFRTLIAESMARQRRPISPIDPRRRRHSLAAAESGLYLGLYQVKEDGCACECEASGQHCAHCVGTERGYTVPYQPTEEDFAQVAGLSSPA